MGTGMHLMTYHALGPRYLQEARVAFKFNHAITPACESRKTTDEYITAANHFFSRLVTTEDTWVDVQAIKFSRWTKFIVVVYIKYH